MVTGNIECFTENTEDSEHGLYLLLWLKKRTFLLDCWQL